MCVFFLFKQKTAYEMRISDWSSDVCSSDLLVGHAQALFDNASSSMHAEIDSLRTALATMHNEIAGRRTEVDQQAQKLLAAGDGFSQQMSQTTGHLSGETD